MGQKLAGKRWRRAFPGASLQLWLRCVPSAPVGKKGRLGSPAGRGLLGAPDSGEDIASSPPAVKARQVKGRDPSAQVSSSSPGQGGVGARTSGSGECPFGDVRSPSAAPPVPPHLPRSQSAGARPRRPTYTQVRCAPVRPHLPAHCPAIFPAQRSPGPIGLILSRDRTQTAPLPFVW